MKHRTMRILAVLVLCFSAWQPAQALEALDGRLIIDNEGGLADRHVTWVIAELETGLAALQTLGIRLRTDKFPITVTLKTGRGISRSYHGRGPIVLHRIESKRSPIIHELTHMLAGYTRANGHWTTEGFASHMQDRYGSDIAYPTRRMPYELMRVILDNNATLPMIEVMKDRRRETYFGKRNLWHRFLAYAQSSSFCTYLIDTYGIQKFFAIYDQPYEDQGFQATFGKSAPALVADRHTLVRTRNTDLRRARRIYKNIREYTR